MRAKQQLNLPIVTFPAMAVWHILATAKDLNWETYYYFRNDLITFAIHFQPNYIYTVSNLTKEITESLLNSNYDRAHMLIKAFGDYLQDPDLLTKSAPEVRHPALLQLPRPHESQDQKVQFTSIELLSQWCEVIAQGCPIWASVTKAWKDASEELTSLAFWQQYLNLQKPAQLSTASILELEV